MERPEGKEKSQMGKNYKLSKGTCKCILLGMCILYNVERVPNTMLGDQIISFDWQNHIKVFGVVYLRLI